MPPALRFFSSTWYAIITARRTYPDVYELPYGSKPNLNDSLPVAFLLKNVFSLYNLTRVKSRMTAGPPCVHRESWGVGGKTIRRKNTVTQLRLTKETEEISQEERNTGQLELEIGNAKGFLGETMKQLKGNTWHRIGGKRDGTGTTGICRGKPDVKQSCGVCIAGNGDLPIRKKKKPNQRNYCVRMG